MFGEAGVRAFWKGCAFTKPDLKQNHLAVHLLVPASGRGGRHQGACPGHVCRWEVGCVWSHRGECHHG